jgi:hypothetical protein
MLYNYTISTLKYTFKHTQYQHPVCTQKQCNYTLFTYIAVLNTATFGTLSVNNNNINTHYVHIIQF